MKTLRQTLRARSAASAAIALALAPQLHAQAKAPAAPPAGNFSCELAGCITYALTRHPEVDAAKARTEAAQATIGARSAEKAPSLTIGGSSGYLRGSPTSPFVGLGGIDQFGVRRFVRGMYYTGEAVLEIPAFTHGALTLGGSRYTNAARLDAGAKALAEGVTRREVAQRVATAYFAVLKYRHQVPLLEKAVQFREADVRMAQAQLDRKLITRSDALVVEVAAATARHAVAQAKLAQRSSEQEFATALGMSMLSPIDIREPAQAPAPPPPIEQLLARIGESPAVKSAELSAQSQREEAASLRKDRLPTASILARYALADDYRPPIADEGSVSFQLIWKVFDSGLSSRQAAVAAAGEREEQAKARNERLLLEGGLREVHARYQQLSEDAKLLEAQVEQANEALLRARGQAGASLTSVDVVNRAEVALLELQLAQNENTWERRYAGAQLQILNGDWDGGGAARPRR